MQNNPDSDIIKIDNAQYMRIKIKEEIINNDIRSEKVNDSIFIEEEFNEDLIKKYTNEKNYIILDFANIFNYHTENMHVSMMNQNLNFYKLNVLRFGFIGDDKGKNFMKLIDQTFKINDNGEVTTFIHKLKNPNSNEIIRLHQDITFDFPQDYNEIKNVLKDLIQ